MDRKLGGLIVLAVLAASCSRERDQDVIIADSARGTMCVAHLRNGVWTKPDCNSTAHEVTDMLTPPKVGDVQGGYRFKGGDPAKETSWEKVP